LAGFPPLAKRFKESPDLNYKTEFANGTTTVEVTGRFTFGDHSSFRKLIEEVRGHGSSTLVLDISGVDFIDSAGLGMLLLARDEGEKSNTNVILRGAQGQVKRMLEVARFDTLFQLEN
jgi:anti-anti-sigma factor